MGRYSYSTYSQCNLSEAQQRSIASTSWSFVIWRAGFLPNVVRVRKFELPMHPELVVDFTCVGFGEGKLLIFNTLSRDGVVYDVRDGRQLQVLEPPPPDQKGEILCSTSTELCHRSKFLHGSLVTRPRPYSDHSVRSQRISQ